MTWKIDIVVLIASMTTDSTLLCIYTNNLVNMTLKYYGYVCMPNDAKLPVTDILLLLLLLNDVVLCKYSSRRDYIYYHSSIDDVI